MSRQLQTQIVFLASEILSIIEKWPQVKNNVLCGRMWRLSKVSNAIRKIKHHQHKSLENHHYIVRILGCIENDILKDNFTTNDTFTSIIE